MSQFDTLACEQMPAASATPVRVARSKAKRAMDVLLACGALLLLAPVLALIALAIWLEDHEPIFFSQQRTGLGGGSFRIYKFRTMSVAEDGGHVRQAVRGDARVTKVGGVLRALSLDELPQLLNVVRGEMSLVGPRPHALAHDQAWQHLAPNYAGRFRTRPGLTGYAQVNGLRGEVRGRDYITRRIEADNYYIENWSIALELWIVLRTIPLLFHDPRAY